MRRGPRLRTALAAQHRHLHTSPRTHTSTTTTHPARERNRWTLLRSTARCQRPSPKARLRKRKERHRACAWRCKGAVSDPYWFLQQIIHGLNARHRRRAPRGMGQQRKVWRATQSLLPQDVQQADLMLTVCRMRRPGTKQDHRRNRAPTKPQAQVLSLPTNQANQRLSEACLAPLSHSRATPHQHTRQHRRDQPRRAQIAQQQPKAIMRWRLTPKPRRRVHQPKAQRHRQTPPSHITPISPRHQPTRSSPPRHRSRPPTAPPPHQGAVKTPPRRTQSSPPTQLNAHTSPLELPQPRSEKLDRQTRRHQYAPRPPSRVPPTLTLSHNTTMPHFGDMISSRLGKAHGTCSGSRDPCHCHHWTQPPRAPVLERLQHMMQEAAHRMSIKGPRTSTILSLLRDLAMLAMNRAWDRGLWTTTIEHITAVVAVLADRDPREEDISPPSDTSPKPKQTPGDPLPLHVARKGIGAAGTIPIESDTWRKHKPAGMDRALRVAPDMGESDDAALAALAKAMHRDGLLIQCTDQPTANMRAFPKPKSAEKGALIADLRLLNALMGSPPQPFELPSLTQLAALLEILRARGVKAHFTKLDVSNMYWSVLLPKEHATSFRFRFKGTTYAIPSLPFGWVASPNMAIEVLAAYLTLHFPGDTILIQYVDDILLVSADPHRLHLETTMLGEDLHEAGWIVSPKSQVIPATDVSWMGKELRGDEYTLLQPAEYMATTIAMWIRLATKGYHHRTMRRLCGKLIWVSRPGRGAMPFLSGALAWLNWGPKQAKYTPPAVLRGLMEAIAVSLTPWQAPPALTDRAETWFVDAAFDDGGWTAALWTAWRGIRIWALPPWVKTQQGAELAAIQMAAKTAAYEGLTNLHLVADNMSAIWSTIRSKGSTGSPDRARHLRRIAHTLRWSHLRMRLSWIASRFNPADCPSRKSKYQSFLHMAADAEATYCALQKCPEHRPRHMGWAMHRG